MSLSFVRVDPPVQSTHITWRSSCDFPTIWAQSFHRVVVLISWIVHVSHYGNGIMIKHVKTEYFVEVDITQSIFCSVFVSITKFNSKHIHQLPMNGLIKVLLIEFY